MRCGGLGEVPPIWPDSSPELLPADDILCSTFCLDEEAEASITASKEPVFLRLPVLSCDDLSRSGFVQQGPGPPWRQAGPLLHLSSRARHSLHWHSDRGSMSLHSAAPCCLGVRRPCPVLCSVCNPAFRPLRFGDIAARYHGAGSEHHTSSLVIDMALQQTMPLCTALQPGRGDLIIHRKMGTFASLHHTGFACSPRSSGSDCSVYLHRSTSLVLGMSGSASGTACKRPASSISQEGSPTETVPPASAIRRWFYASLFIILQEEEWSPQDSQDLLAEASSQLEPLSGLALFERIWLLPEGRHLPRLMQAFRERFGIRFGRCLEMLQAPSATPTTGPSRALHVEPDVQGTRSKAAAAPHARARSSGHRRP